MSAPRHAAPGWDDAQDQADALASLDATVRKEDVLTQEGSLWNDAAGAVTPPADEARIQALQEAARKDQLKTLQARQNTTLHRKSKARRASGDDPRTLRRKTARKRPAPVPSQPYDVGSVPDETGRFAPVEKPARSFAGLRLALLLFVLALRLLAIALCALVVVYAIPALVARTDVVRLSNALALLMPAQLQGRFVFQTPFGGAFRGDVVVLALAVYVADWLLTNLRARIGQRRAAA